MVFGPESRYVEHVATGQRMPMTRKKGVFVLELKAVAGEKAKARRHGKAAMDIEEVEAEEEEMNHEEMDMVEKVGDLWFRKMVEPETRDFSRQA